MPYSEKRPDFKKNNKNSSRFLKGLIKKIRDF